MRILFVIDSLLVGGTEKSILEIAKRFKYITPEFCILFNKAPNLDKEYESAGMKVHRLNLNEANRLSWIFEGRKKLAKVVKEVNPDAIHAHLFNGEFLTRITKYHKKLPLIGAFVNDSYSIERYQNQSFWQNTKLNFYRLLDRISAPRFDYFTSVTSSVADTNAKALNIPRSKIHVIHRGRNIEVFKAVHPTYLQGKDTFIFQVVARVLVRKGFFELIQALKLLKNSDGHKILCRVAGEGVDMDNIKRYAVDSQVSDVIDFLNNRNDIPELLGNAHCFVLPSHYEGTGGSLLEAMLAAKPIIATDIPVFREHIENAKTGLLFHLKDSKDLADKMLWMMDNYLQAVEMGKKALAVAREKYEIDNIAKQYEDFYTKIIQKA